MNKLWIVLLVLFIVPMTYATIYEWSGGVPVQSDNTNYEWSGGVPYIIYEHTVGGDSCSCPSINTNWAIDLSDTCTISTNCDIGTGNITFTSTGTITFNADITAYSIGPLPANQNGYLGENVNIRVG